MKGGVVMNVREIALRALDKVFSGSYSNIVLNDYLNNYELSDSDRALLSEIVYGTIAKKLTLEFYLAPFIKGRMRQWQRNLLMLSVYQLVYLDRIPPYAVINEAVEITKTRGGLSASKVTNAILRNFEREPLRDFSDVKNDKTRLSVLSSIPQWIIEHWITHYKFEGAVKIAESLQDRPKLYARVNTRKTTRDTLIEQLTAEGLEVEAATLHQDGIISKTNQILKHPLFFKGMYSIQDISSMFVHDAVNPKHDDVVLDACSAPGGKGLHVAEKLTDGHADLADVHPHKITLIDNAAKRLEIDNYSAFVADATAFDYGKKYDKIIVDAPCSGLGVIRRKPEIRYERKSEDIQSLVKLQLEILNHVKQFLKPGGELIYSTCTIHQMENENVAYTFMKQNEDIEFEPFDLPTLNFSGHMRQILPYEFDTDGFFIAKFKRKSD